MYGSIAVAVLALLPFSYAQCGSGSPDAVVDGSTGSYTTTAGGSEVYSGSDYLAAIQTGIDSISSGQRISVIASGDIGASTISIDSGKTFEGCGTINVGYKAGVGAIESLGTTGVSIPYLSMTGDPYFGLHFYGTTDLTLGEINLDLSGGLGIRFDRDEAANSNVKMGTITVTGASSHAVETWNIDGLTIDAVIARDVGECGLLLQGTTNAQVGLVDGDNVAAGTGYATFRMANNNGQLADGSYDTNVYIDRVVSRGGGRGVFCVSQSGAAEIASVDLADNGNNAVLIENCYNVAILDGTVDGGGEVDGTTVRESPCGENISWSITGDASLDIC
ncbi:hypothetical protein KC331_g3935 [Hortaea werneckii]|nr:hypothetical protein KC331_g3935 [Hortaea werneckii]KAI7718141.1 hypothetical protein KC353_g4003 [Hortaea werneckii]